LGTGIEFVPPIFVVEPGDPLLVADPQASGGVEIEVYGMINLGGGWNRRCISRQLLPLQMQRAGAPVDPHQCDLVPHPQPAFAVLEDLPVLVQGWQRIARPFTTRPSDDSLARPNLRIDARNPPSFSASRAA